jgi:glycosyltransferase involved in cell wall biosynthesis
MEERSLPVSSPAVSVIVPAYNVAKYIGEALDSILAQTFKDYEIIVVNDGSPDTDELERVLEPYLDSIVYIKQENRGLSGARNTAIRAARAELISLLDADDKWYPDYLAVHVEAMRSNPTIDLFYADATIFGEGLDIGERYMNICPSDGEVTFESVVTQKCNVLVSATIKREAIIRAGMFDESLRSAEDYDLWLRILKNGGRIAYNRQPLMYYRRRPGSLSSDPLWMSEHGAKVLKKLRESLDLSDEERRILDQQIAKFMAQVRLFEGKRAFFKGECETAIKSFKEANSYLKSRKLSLVLIFLRLAPRLLLRLYNMRDRFVYQASTKY